MNAVAAPVAPQFVVKKSVLERNDIPTQHGTTLYAYRCDLEDGNGIVYEGVEITQKPDSPPPVEGTTICAKQANPGDQILVPGIRLTQHGPKLGRDWNGERDAGFQPQTPPPGSALAAGVQPPQVQPHPMASDPLVGTTQPPATPAPIAQPVAAPAPQIQPAAPAHLLSNDAKQRLIVRQFCIKAALELLAGQQAAGTIPSFTLADVKTETANFEKYVFEAEAVGL